MSGAEYEEFPKITTGNMADVIKPGGVLFLCIDWRHAEVLMRVVRDLGLDLLNMAVWAKHQPGMGSLYRSQHEFVLVAKRPGHRTRTTYNSESTAGTEATFGVTPGPLAERSRLWTTSRFTRRSSR
jgi:hypothetical protein